MGGSCRPLPAAAGAHFKLPKCREWAPDGASHVQIASHLDMYLRLSHMCTYFHSIVQPFCANLVSCTTATAAVGCSTTTPVCLRCKPRAAASLPRAPACFVAHVVRSMPAAVTSDLTASSLQMYQQAAFCLEELLLHAPADPTRCAGAGPSSACFGTHSLCTGAGPGSPPVLAHPMRWGRDQGCPLPAGSRACLLHAPAWRCNPAAQALQPSWPVGGCGCLRIMAPRQAVMPIARLAPRPQAPAICRHAVHAGRRAQLAHSTHTLLWCAPLLLRAGHEPWVSRPLFGRLREGVASMLPSMREPQASSQR